MAPATRRGDRITFPIVAVAGGSGYRAIGLAGSRSSWRSGQNFAASAGECLERSGELYHRGGLMIVEHGIRYTFGVVTVQGGAEIFALDASSAGNGGVGGLLWKLSPATTVSLVSPTRFHAQIPVQAPTPIGGLRLPSGAAGSLVIDVQVEPPSSTASRPSRS